MGKGNLVPSTIENPVGLSTQNKCKVNVDATGNYLKDDEGEKGMRGIGRVTLD